MPSSGSTNFSIGGDELLKSSLRVLGVLDPNETPDAATMNNARQALNMSVKSLAGEMHQVFLQKKATLFLQNSKTSYLLGITGNHATNSYSSTTMRLAASASATTLEVTSTSGMTAADYIGIILDSGNVHWTTIASVTDSDTVVITTGLASSSAIGKNIYWYTTKISRPIAIIQAFIHAAGNNDYGMDVLNRDEYWGMSNKSYTGRPTGFYYENLKDNGVLYTNYQATDFTETLDFIYRKTIDDFDISTDTPDLPQEWYEFLKYDTAMKVAPEHGRIDIVPELSRMAMSSKLSAMGSTGDVPRRMIPTQF